MEHKSDDDWLCRRFSACRLTWVSEYKFILHDFLLCVNTSGGVFPLSAPFLTFLLREATINLPYFPKTYAASHHSEEARL